MISFAKFFVDIAKALNAPVWLLTHGVTVIIVGASVWAGSSFYHSKNEKIESVPVILAAIDTLRNEMIEVKVEVQDLKQVNKSDHDSFKNDINKGFGGVKSIFQKQDELNNQRFNSLSNKNEEQFYLQRKWLLEDIDKLLSTTEKKNFNLYQLTLIQ